MENSTAQELAERFLRARRLKHLDSTMMMSAGKRVVIYTRVSLDRTGEGLAVDRQLLRCRKRIEANDYAGWVEVAHKSDNSISAYTGKHRPAWSEVLDLIRSGSVDIVLAWHLDRMTRSVVELEELIALCEEYGVDIVTIEGDIDLSRATGRLVARILAAVARAEVEMKTARQLLKFDQMAEAGKPFTGGRRAFGYELDRMTIVEDEAAAIRWAAEEYLADMPLADIAREWDRRGLSSSRRNDFESTTGWSATGVRQVLENPRYAAIRMHRGEKAGPAAWPAILDEEVHLAIVAKLSSKKLAPDDERRGNGPKPRTLLTSIAVCYKCGLKATAGRDGIPLYVCRSPAKHFVVPREAVDHEVSSAVIAFLSLPDVAARLAPEEDSGRVMQAREEAASARARLAQIGDDYADGLIDRETMLRATERLRERIQDADEVLGRSVVGTDLEGLEGIGTEQVAETWSSLPLNRQRAIIELVTQEIVIVSLGPGRRWRPDAGLKIRFVGDRSLELVS